MNLNLEPNETLEEKCARLEAENNRLTGELAQSEQRLMDALWRTVNPPVSEPSLKIRELGNEIYDLKKKLTKQEDINFHLFRVVSAYIGQDEEYD